MKRGCGSQNAGCVPGWLPQSKAPDSQSWDINGDQIRLSGTSLCLDGLGGSLFNTGRHDKFGLYDCKDSVNQKFSWENGGLALSTPLNLKHPGVLCVETRGNDVVPAEKAKVSCQSWEITDGPTQQKIWKASPRT